MHPVDCVEMLTTSYVIGTWYNTIRIFPVMDNCRVGSVILDVLTGKEGFPHCCDSSNSVELKERMR
jgi:hypothetical protein